MQAATHKDSAKVEGGYIKCNPGLCDNAHQQEGHFDALLWNSELPEGLLQQGGSISI